MNIGTNRNIYVWKTCCLCRKRSKPWKLVYCNGLLIICNLSASTVSWRERPILKYKLLKIQTKSTLKYKMNIIYTDIFACLTLHKSPKAVVLLNGFSFPCVSKSSALKWATEKGCTWTVAFKFEPGLPRLRDGIYR